VVGTRNMLKSLLAAMVEPTAKLRAVEAAGDYTSRLVLQEEFKTLPFGAVWDYYCATKDVPVGPCWLSEVKQYESSVLSRRA